MPAILPLILDTSKPPFCRKTFCNLSASGPEPITPPWCSANEQQHELQATSTFQMAGLRTPQRAIFTFSSFKPFLLFLHMVGKGPLATLAQNKEGWDFGSDDHGKQDWKAGPPLSHPIPLSHIPRGELTTGALAVEVTYTLREASQNTGSKNKDV